MHNPKPEFAYPLLSWNFITMQQIYYKGSKPDFSGTKNVYLGRTQGGPGFTARL